MTYSYDSLGKMYSEAAAAIRFVVKIKGDIDGKIADTLESMLTSMGFTISADGPLHINGQVVFQDTDLRRRDLVFVRYEIRLDLIDAAGNTVAGMVQRGREGHVSSPEARARCVRSVSESINRDFSRRLQAYFDGLIKK